MAGDAHTFGEHDEHYAIELAIKTGDLACARELLRDAIARHPSAEVWYLAALAARTEQQRGRYLHKALAADPDHRRARAALEHLEGRNAGHRPLPEISPAGRALATRLAIIIGLAGVVYLAFFPFVPQNDPLAYLQGAQTLAAGAPMWNQYDHAFVLWPPGYPFLIALGIQAGWTALESARIVNAVAFGIMYALADEMLRRYVPRLSLRIAGSVAMIIGPLLALSLSVMSEIVFIAVQCALLMALLSADRDTTARRVLVIGVLAGAGAMVRYVGLAGVVVAGVVLLLALPRRRWWLLAVYALPAIGPILMWWARNYAITGTFIGDRGGTARVALAGNVGEMGATVLTWLIYWAALAGLALAVDRWRRVGGDAAPMRRLWPLLAYAGLMLVINVAFGSWSYLGEDNYRLLIGMYIPLMVWLLAAASNLSAQNLQLFSKRTRQ